MSMLSFAFWKLWNVLYKGYSEHWSVVANEVTVYRRMMYAKVLISTLMYANPNYWLFRPCTSLPKVNLYVWMLTFSFFLKNDSFFRFPIVYLFPFPIILKTIVFFKFLKRLFLRWSENETKNDRKTKKRSYNDGFQKRLTTLFVCYSTRG